jgi:hypothetical protein
VFSPPEGEPDLRSSRGDDAAGSASDYWAPKVRDVDYCRDDERVKRVLGLKRLPVVATVSRSLSSADVASVDKVRGESRNEVIARLCAGGLSRVTPGFDGSVLSMARHAEGTATGFHNN